MNLYRLKTAAVATAFVLPLGLAATASAQLTDSDSVGIQAEIVTPITVEAQGDINLGQIPANEPAFEVAAEDDDFDSAAFEIIGADSLDWELDIVFAALTHEDGTTTDTIGIAALAGGFCFAIDDGSPTLGDCETAGDFSAATGDSAVSFTVEQAEHGGQGIARVGFQVDPSAAAAPGIYENENAITLTASVILGSGD
jgi:hypothetical protein